MLPNVGILFQDHYGDAMKTFLYASSIFLLVACSPTDEAAQKNNEPCETSYISHKLVAEIRESARRIEEISVQQQQLLNRISSNVP